jgi:hypothetical protein
MPPVLEGTDVPVESLPRVSSLGGARNIIRFMFHHDKRAAFVAEKTVTDPDFGLLCEARRREAEAAAGGAFGPGSRGNGDRVPTAVIPKTTREIAGTADVCSPELPYDP